MSGSSINCLIDNMSSIDLTYSEPMKLECVLSYKGSWYELGFNGFIDLFKVWRLLSLQTSQVVEFSFKGFSVSAGQWLSQYILRFSIGAPLAGQSAKAQAVDIELILLPSVRAELEDFVSGCLPQ